MPFTQCADLDELIAALEGHYVVALEQHSSSTPLFDAELPNDRPVTLVVGEEIGGLSDELVERTDSIVEIPMAGSKESLNVASAFAVAAYVLSAKLGSVDSSMLVSRNDCPATGS